MHYKKEGLPEEGDIVICTVKNILHHSVFASLDEYKNVEGLIHISELSWKRVDNPEDIVKVAENIKAEIIGIDNNKITLSIKKLKKDPWQKAIKNYKVGQKVSGEVIKIEPFGAFIQLDKDIHGLLHVSEFSKKDKDGKRQDLKLGDKKEFKILSIEPEEHRLGLSIRALGEKEEDKSEEVDKKAKKSSKLEKKEKVDKKDKVKSKDKSKKKEKSKL